MCSSYFLWHLIQLCLVQGLGVSGVLEDHNFCKAGRHLILYIWYFPCLNNLWNCESIFFIYLGYSMKIILLFSNLHAHNPTPGRKMIWQWCVVHFDLYLLDPRPLKIHHQTPKFARCLHASGDGSWRPTDGGGRRATGWGVPASRPGVTPPPPRSSQRCCLTPDPGDYFTLVPSPLPGRRCRGWPGARHAHSNHRQGRMTSWQEDTGYFITFYLEACVNWFGEMKGLE